MAQAALIRRSSRVRLPRPPDLRPQEDRYAAHLMMVLNQVWASIREALPYLLAEEERADAAEGEGSRGGHVTGHTKSGNPIYGAPATPGQHVEPPKHLAKSHVEQPKIEQELGKLERVSEESRFFKKGEEVRTTDIWPHAKGKMKIYSHKKPSGEWEARGQIDPSKVIPSQPSVLVEDVRKYARDPGAEPKGGGEVHVAMHEGRAHVVAGHHRLAAASLSGKDSVSVVKTFFITEKNPRTGKEEVKQVPPARYRSEHKQDAAPVQIIVTVFDQLRVGIYQLLRPATSRAAAQTGSAVYQKGRQHAKSAMKQLLRIDLPEQEPWLAQLMTDWVTENVSLIRSVGEESLADVEQTLLRMIREGKSRKETEEELEKQFNLSRSRARLIARDQVNKLNGQITKARQTRLGLKTYEWTTANDQRVRGRPGGAYPDANPSHWVMEGMLCRWDDPTVYSPDGGKTWKARSQRMPKSHPGQDIQCRCFGQPSLKELLTT